MKSALNGLWRLLPTEFRRHALYRIAAAVAPKAGEPPPICDGQIGLAGELSRSSGLGEGARLMIQALHAQQIPTTPLDIGTLSEPRRLTDQEKHSLSDRAALILHVNSPQLPIALNRMGRVFVQNRRIVGYWAWELPTLPPIWRAGLRCVHEIWAPSAFTASALETIAPGRVKVVPHPLAVEPPRPSVLDRSAFGVSQDAVMVLLCFNLASSFVRKNPISAIRAFREAFGDRKDRVLFVKMTETHHYPEDERTLREALAGMTNVMIETRELPPGDLHALTHLSDIVLSLHRSEGFGLIPAQAMLLERPVVATDWSATAEYLDESCGFPVAYHLVPARDPRGVFEAEKAVWAEADIHDAARKLRIAADDAVLRKRLGAAARQRAQERFSPQALLRAVDALSRSDATS
ncbi:glycosyltransferase family 4 protein [Kozakia baliensis]|uniref:glycosyltransferase family 4 protein n=1 Tax=Kozakia baliensis TaxID=153496 RepID=UPI00087C0F4D|nr:glycosyltransferase family 4 protein [Kozakia baliensis]AOX19109.1 mannosyltransferase [Kozakia baliensis]